MDPTRDREELCNTGPDEETVMREKKRLRRVSFAENTEVHVFDRDDEDYSSETPPQPPLSPLSSHRYPKLGLLAQSNDNNDNGEGEEEDGNDRFLRDLDSSSPGSGISSATSATSNDEDNFFGPVSASFIRLGQQSDSAASDEHEITLDSTAFSMHFESLVPSESTTGNCKTPKTPSFEGKFSMPTNSESFMVMTQVKNRIDYTPVSGGDSGGGRDSNDMCMIKKGKSDKFEYGILSPTLEALIAQSREEMDHNHVADQRSVARLSNHHSSESKIEEMQVDKGGEVFNKNRGDASTDMVYNDNNQLFEANSGTEITPVSKSSSEYIFNRVDSLVAEASATRQNETFVELIQGQGTAGASANDVDALKSNANGPINLGILKSIGNEASRYRTSQRDSGNFGDFVTPLRKGATLNSPLGSADLNFITRTDPVKTFEKISEQNHLHKSASPHVRRTATAVRLEKRLVEGGARDDVRKETQILSESDNLLHFRRRGPPLYTNIPNKVGHEQSDWQSHQTQDRFSAHGIDNSAIKRTIEFGPTDGNNSVEIGNKNLKVTSETGGSVSEFQLEHCPVGNDEREKSASYTSQGHWVDVLKDFPGAMEKLLSPSIGKLNTQELDILEDMVGRMQKATKYEKLSSLVQVQGTPDLLANNHQIRINEAKWLQEMFAFEQAKSLLLRSKQEQLRKKVQLLESRIQEAQKLKFSLKNILQNGVKDAQNKAIALQSHSVDPSNENVETHNKVSAKRKELESLDLKVQKLTKSLLASCKIKGDPRPDECITLLNDYLMKKARCRLIQKELQLCKVDKLWRENGRLNIILNYLDVLHQSFVMSRGSCPKLVTVSKLEHPNIMKSFPNVNACTAFAFVFDETARNLVNCKSLSVETQMIRSLLHSLLIVIGEVQVACIESRNLIWTSFSTPCVELLQLELCFMDFKTGNKVTLILDMTCLKRGVYPLEVHPQISMTQTAGSLSTEIEAAIRSLKAGYLMVLRVCQCVSKVILTWNR